MPQKGHLDGSKQTTAVVVGRFRGVWCIETSRFGNMIAPPGTRRDVAYLPVRGLQGEGGVVSAMVKLSRVKRGAGDPTPEGLEAA